MIIPEYVIVKNEDFRPMLKLKQTYEWDWDGLETCTDLVNMLIDCFDINKLAEEYMFVAAFSATSEFLGIFNVAHGSCKEVYVGRREVFIFLLLIGAVQFVLVHNHPSGSLEISDDDEELTNAFKELGEEIEIELSEHVIVSSKGYVFITANETHELEDLNYFDAIFDYINNKEDENAR